MSEDKPELLDEDQEAQLLQALAAQAPAEEYVATAGEPLPEGALTASGDDIVIPKFRSIFMIWALFMTFAV